MNEFVSKVLEERFVSLYEFFTAQILDSPEERYLNLQKERPDLLNRIPQHQIATFLGITPVSLSRIRNRVTKNSSFLLLIFCYRFALEGCSIFVPSINTKK